MANINPYFAPTFQTPDPAVEALAREAFLEADAKINHKGLRHDPRPDLEADSALWRALLEKADAIDGNDPVGLFGALHGLRCLGAELARVEGRVIMRAGKMDSADYVRERNLWLMPHRETLIKILGEL